MSAGVNESRMGTERIGGLMVSMAVPSIIAQIINILYNIVDRIYIGHIPGVVLALTGVGITFPYYYADFGFLSLVGMGAPLAAYLDGKGDRKHAEKYRGAAPVFWLFYNCFDGCFLSVSEAVPLYVQRV